MLFVSVQPPDKKGQKSDPVHRKCVMWCEKTVSQKAVSTGEVNPVDCTQMKNMLRCEVFSRGLFKMGSWFRKSTWCTSMRT